MINHFILIRFYCLDMLSKDIIFNEDFLRTQFNIFKQYCLTSLENQTCSNFEIILIIHNDINLDKLNFLQNIKSSLKIHIIRYKDVINFLNNHLNNDFFITSRIDHDDIVYKDCIKDIQNLTDYDIPLQFIGFNNGLTMIDNDFENAYLFSPRYDYNGAISIMQTLIVNKILINDNLNIFQVGPHTNTKTHFKDLYNKYNFIFDESYFKLNTFKDYAWIYIQHDANHSMLTTNINKWHRSNIKVNKSKKWFIENFGNCF